MRAVLGAENDCAGGWARDHSQPSTLDPEPSTLDSQLSTFNPQTSTVNPQPSFLEPPGAEDDCASRRARAENDGPKGRTLITAKGREMTRAGGSNTARVVLGAEDDCAGGWARDGVSRDPRRPLQDRCTPLCLPRHALGGGPPWGP